MNIEEMDTIELEEYRDSLYEDIDYLEVQVNMVEDELFKREEWSEEDMRDYQPEPVPVIPPFGD